MLEKGTKIRVTGGKHKGKWGYVMREMPEFCEVRLMEYIKSKATGDDEDVIKERQVRAKTIYVEVIPDTVFEMPDEMDLYAVGDCSVEWDKSLGSGVAEQVAHAKEEEMAGYGPVSTGPPPLPVKKGRGKAKVNSGPNVCVPPDPEVETKMDAIISDLLGHPPPNDDDLLSIHSDDEPVDITDILPTIDEALELKHMVKKNDKVVQELTGEVARLQFEKNELAEALELFMKMSDFFKTRLSLGNTGDSPTP